MVGGRGLGKEGWSGRGVMLRGKRVNFVRVNLISNCEFADRNRFQNRLLFVKHVYAK